MKSEKFELVELAERVEDYGYCLYNKIIHISDVAKSATVSIKMDVAKSMIKDEIARIKLNIPKLQKLLEELETKVN